MGGSHRRSSSSRPQRLLLVLVQLDEASNLPSRLTVRLLRQVSESMHGTSCSNKHALERECFTAQRCGQTGRAARDDAARVVSAAPRTIVLVHGSDLVGLVQAERRIGTEAKPVTFIYNLCVHHPYRKRGYAAQLLAWLAWLESWEGDRTTGFELTVYSPDPRATSRHPIADHVAAARAPWLSRTYEKHGFVVRGGKRDGLVHMHAQQMIALPQPFGRPRLFERME